jgi:hypothetical protein
MEFENPFLKRLKQQKLNSNLQNSKLANEDLEFEEPHTVQHVESKRTSDIADLPIATYFRTKAMMAIYPAKNRVLFKFMEALENGTYDKSSRAYLMIDRDELFKIVVQLDGELQDPVDLFHIHGSEQKTLKIGRGRKDPNTFFVYFVNTNGSGKKAYTISFDAVEFYHFRTILKLLLYEMFTGTRAGFSYNWI